MAPEGAPAGGPAAAPDGALARPRSLDIAISNDDASTIIHVRGTGSSSRMTDMGSVLDRLGVEVISCSATPASEGTDMMLVVVDRHDSQPLDESTAHSVAQGLRSVLEGASSGCSDTAIVGACGASINSSASMCSSTGGITGCMSTSAAAAAAVGCVGQRAHLQWQKQQLPPPRHDSSGCSSSAAPASPACIDPPVTLEATRSSEEHAASLVLQPATQLPIPLSPMLRPLEALAGTRKTGGSPGRVRFAGVQNTELQQRSQHASAAATPGASTNPCGLKPISKNDLPLILRQGAKTADAGNACSAAAGAAAAVPAASAQAGGPESLLQKQQPAHTDDAAAAAAAASASALHAEDLAQRLLQLGVRRRPVACPLSDSDSDGPPARSRVPAAALPGGGAGGQPLQPVVTSKSCGGLLALARQQEAEGTQYVPPPVLQRSGGSDSRAQELAALLTSNPTTLDGGGGGAERPHRRRLPARTPSRIILSPAGPDGAGEPGAAPRVFVAIPKQRGGDAATSDERRAHRPPRRSVTCSSMTPGSGRSSGVVAPALLSAGVLQQLVSHNSLDKLMSGEASPKAAAAAAAAASMPFNVAVAAAQLLGSRTATRDAAVAAIAAAAAKDPKSPLLSPAASQPTSAGNSKEQLPSPLTAPASTPRVGPLTPSTPVHPAVAAAAAAAIAAAAEAAGSGVRELRLMAAPSAILEEDGEVLSSMPASLTSGEPAASLGADGSSLADGPSVTSLMDGSDAGSLASSGSEEWWCGSLTGLTVRDIMTGPLQVVGADADVSLARQLMASHNLPVLLVDTGPDTEPGFLTRRDFLKASLTRRGSRRRGVAPAALRPAVRDIMSHPAVIVEAGQAIELCAALMQEQGIRTAVVRDGAAAALAVQSGDEAVDGAAAHVVPPPHLSAYVGVVSDAAIFRCLGLYPEQGSALDEEDFPISRDASVLRGPSFADGSADGSGAGTPSSSRVAMPAARLASGGGAGGSGNVGSSGGGNGSHDYTAAPAGAEHGACLTGPTAAAASSATSGRRPSVDGATAGVVVTDGGAATATMDPLRLPDLLLLREAVRGGSSMSNSSAGSMVSGLSGCLLQSSAPNAGAAGGATPPDALSRYRTAAALWEIDMAEVEPIRRIGEGSFGEVMVANYRGTKVAVKRLRALDIDDASCDPSSGGSSSAGTGSAGGSHAAFRQFFEREIAILASIRHPNVVNFIGACHKPGQRCLVTEYCARGSLDQVLHKSALTLDLPKRVEFAMDIARGMACLHAQRPIIIHRDLKTANLLVSARFEVKVADFGLSRIKDASHLQVSRAGLEGTIEYCAPEVLRGEPYTERCDVYSFGVVLWELLLRQRPYADAEAPVFLLMVNIGNGTLALPPVPESAATPALCAITAHCLAFSAADRPDFREVLAALEAEYRVLRSAAAAAAAGRCSSATAQSGTPSVASVGAMQPPSSSRAWSGGDGVDAASGGQPSSASSTPGGGGGGSGGSGQPARFIGGDGQQQPVAPHQVLPLPLPLQQLQQQQVHPFQTEPGVLASGNSAAQLLTVPLASYEQASGQLLGLQLPQLLLPHQPLYVQPAVSMPGSPRAQQQQQQQMQQQQMQMQQQWAQPLQVQQAPTGGLMLGGMCMLPAYGTAQQPQAGQPRHMMSSGHAAGGVCGSSAAKPPRANRMSLNRARSLPTPDSCALQGEDDDAEHMQQNELGLGGVGSGDSVMLQGAHDVLLLPQEDSFSSGANLPAVRWGSSYAPGGQLCVPAVLLDPSASANHSGALPQVQLPGVHTAPSPQPSQPGAAQHGQHVVQAPQPLLFAPAGQVPLLFAPPAGQQGAYVPYIQLQQQQHQVQQMQQMPHPVGAAADAPAAPVHMWQASAAHAAAYQRGQLQRGLFTPSPTPGGGMCTPPLSSSPASHSLHPLALMAAASAAARRDAAGGGGAAVPMCVGSSGSPSPARLPSGSDCVEGLQRRSSSQCSGRGVPLLHLAAAGGGQAHDTTGSPTPLSARDARPGGCDTGASTPVLGGGAPLAGTLLLQRLDSLARSGSASPRSGSYAIVPGPSLVEQSSGQLVGVFVGAAPALGGGSPLSAAGLSAGGAVGGSSGGGAAAAAPAHHHPHHHGLLRHGSSRLAIQGSHELPPGIATTAAAAVMGSVSGEHVGGGGSSSSGGGGGCPAGVAGMLGGCPAGGGSSGGGSSSIVTGGFPPHHGHAAPPPQPPQRRPHSLLRIDSNSRDRCVSPGDAGGARVAPAAAAASGFGRSPVPSGTATMRSSSGGVHAASPFAAAAAASSSTACTSSLLASPSLTATGVVTATTPMASSSASPFAAASAAGVPASPFASAAGDDGGGCSSSSGCETQSAALASPFAAAASLGTGIATPPNARLHSPFAAVAAAAAGGCSEGDTQAVTDRSSAKHSVAGTGGTSSPVPASAVTAATAATGGGGGGGCTAAPKPGSEGGRTMMATVSDTGGTERPALSPFALLQVPAEDDAA